MRISTTARVRVSLCIGELKHSTLPTLSRHPGEGRGPAFSSRNASSWIPAFAGMTMNERRETRDPSPAMTLRTNVITGLDPVI
jgi:hypothetical protein